MAVVNRDYRLIWVKEPLLAGLRSSVKVLGEHCFSVMANRNRPCETGCPVAPVFATGRPHSVERSYTGPDGQTYWREARAFPIMDGRGRVTFVVRISFDITGRKHQQAFQRRGIQTLERALDEMNRLQVSQMPFQPSGEASLTQRELEVLRLLVRGASKPQIAVMLGISVHTVKRHVVNIYNKIGVNDRTQAAVWAARQGLA